MKHKYCPDEATKRIMNKYSAYLYQPWLYPAEGATDRNVPIPSEQAVDDARSWEEELEL